MSNALFDAGREGFLDGTINWALDDIRVMLARASYGFDPAHRVLADLGAVDNGRSEPLHSKTCHAGVADAADTSLIATAAVACGALILFQHTGHDASARLIGYIDDTASGLPFTPAVSQHVPITWDNGPNKIFKL